MTYAHNYYDPDRGWTNTNPGWYEIRIEPKTGEHHLEMVKWLYDNVDNPERHTRWQLVDVGTNLRSCFKFRYERDYIWFKLKWV